MTKGVSCCELLRLNIKTIFTEIGELKGLMQNAGEADQRTNLLWAIVSKCLTFQEFAVASLFNHTTPTDCMKKLVMSKYNHGV